MHRAALIESKGGPGRPKSQYQREPIDLQEAKLLHALDILNLHNERPKFAEVGVYNSKNV